LGVFLLTSDSHFFFIFNLTKSALNHNQSYSSFIKFLFDSLSIFLHLLIIFFIELILEILFSRFLFLYKRFDFDYDTDANIPGTRKPENQDLGLFGPNGVPDDIPENSIVRRGVDSLGKKYWELDKLLPTGKYPTFLEVTGQEGLNYMKSKGYIGTDYTGIGPNGQYYKHGYPATNPNDVNDSRRHRAQVTPPPQNAQTAKVNAAVNAPTQSGWGPWKGDKMPIFQDRYGVTNAADKFDRIKNWDDVTKQLGYTGPKYNLSFQKWLYNSSPENKAIVDKWHNQYKQGPNAGMFDGKIGIRWASALNEILDGNKPVAPQIPTIDRQALLSQVGQNLEPRKSPDLLQAPLNPGEVDGEAQGMKRADWEFTPWQKISQAYNWGQVANVKRYMPYRSRYNATYADPALLNPEQAVGDVKGSLNQQINSLGTLNPIMRNAQAAASYGQAISQIPGIRSQYDNQNAQIMNQFRQYNNQVRNNESMVNMANDQTYYQQAIEGRKNFDNMRQFTANNAMNNVLRDVETNQKLAYNMLTLNNPAYGYDWKSGDFYRNKKDIMDVQSASNQQENLLQLAEDLKQKGYSEKLIGDILKTKAFQTWQPTQVPKFKKGGKTKNPYK